MVAQFTRRGMDKAIGIYRSYALTADCYPQGECKKVAERLAREQAARRDKVAARYAREMARVK